MKLTNRHKEKFVRNLKSVNGHVLQFRIDEVGLPNGKRARRAYLNHPGAVGALAFDAKGRIILVKQYRYPVKEFTYEIPAGKLSKGETPLACLKRELEEEAGVQAKRIRPLLTFWPTAAFATEILHLYIAEDLVTTQPNPDEDEFLELLRVTPKQFESMMRRGKIHDAKTLIAYLAWRSKIFK